LCYGEGCGILGVVLLRTWVAESLFRQHPHRIFQPFEGERTQSKVWLVDTVNLRG